LHALKKPVFHLLLWTPLLLIAAALFHLAFRTNLPQLVYMDSIRNIEQEAHDFAKIPDRYRTLLEGKRLIIFESSGWLSDSPRFKNRFATELGDLEWPQARVLDTTKILAGGDSFVLADHLEATGHRKLAAATANEIDDWERADPILDSRAAK
jgi:hypothetical protein